MARANEESRYGKITASKVKIPADEPVFLVRATDPFATSTIIDYARRCERDGAAKAVVDEAFDHAMRVAEWQRHNPERVKPLPELEKAEVEEQEPEED
jgi:hypothetical protein